MFEHPFMRPLRLQLNKVNEIAKRRLFDGGTAEEYHQKKAEKRLRQIWRARAVEFDRCGCAVCVCLAWQCSHGSWVYGVSPFYHQEAHQQHPTSRRADCKTEAAH